MSSVRFFCRPLDSSSSSSSSSSTRTGRSNRTSRLNRILGSGQIVRSLSPISRLLFPVSRFQSHTNVSQATPASQLAKPASQASPASQAQPASQASQPAKPVGQIWEGSGRSFWEVDALRRQNRSVPSNIVFQ